MSAITPLANLTNNLPPRKRNQSETESDFFDHRSERWQKNYSTFLPKQGNSSSQHEEVENKLPAPKRFRSPYHQSSFVTAVNPPLAPDFPFQGPYWRDPEFYASGTVQLEKSKTLMKKVFKDEYNLHYFHWVNTKFNGLTWKLTHQQCSAFEVLDLLEILKDELNICKSLRVGDEHPRVSGGYRSFDDRNGEHWEMTGTWTKSGRLAVRPVLSFVGWVIKILMKKDDPRYPDWIGPRVGLNLGQAVEFVEALEKLAKGEEEMEEQGQGPFPPSPGSSKTTQEPDSEGEIEDDISDKTMPLKIVKLETIVAEDTVD